MFEILIPELLSLNRELEWIEYKIDNIDPYEIGKNISAISNSAALMDKEKGYIIWGINSDTLEVVGTSFQPHATKQGNQELHNFLATQLAPRIDFQIHEGMYNEKRLVVFEVPAVREAPSRFKGIDYIRIGSCTKTLSDHVEKERTLWSKLSKNSFESGIAKNGLSEDEIITQLDLQKFFALTGQPITSVKSAALERLILEKMITSSNKNVYNVTNLGAILFAKNLEYFPSLKRKAVRVIIYKGINRIDTLQERPGIKGYAAGFEKLIEFINNQLPKNEIIGKVYRKEVTMYPEIVIRELVANALIHQDFSINGTGPMIEIFSDRIEITNPGVPLIDAERFLDLPPQSRNDFLASFMRRIHICEERGSGIDKVIELVEEWQLPAPLFIVTDNHTKAIIYAYKQFSKMDKNDRIRACYQHASLQWVQNQKMTNTSLRGRFGIKEENYSIASRIISDTLEAKFIKQYDPTNTSKKHTQYVPSWAT